MSWIGQTDLDVAAGDPKAGLGPIATAISAQKYDVLCFLSGYQPEKVDSYVKWLRERSSADILPRLVPLSSPTAYGEIYQAAVHELETLQKNFPNANITFHLSPGTPAMAAVWIILAKTRFPARLIESSRDAGVRVVSVPFALTAEYLPDQVLTTLSESRPPLAPAFTDIIHQSEAMRRVLEQAQRIADRSIPVLIEGESGTGKELLARAIHESGSRKNKELQVVNCGAIPPNLAESVLFGHRKGAFTGALADTEGYFRAAHKGTLFLDEIGELPLDAQVKFLRVLQEGKVTPVGGTKAESVDVRIIAATNRSLIQEATDGRFRWDLFYRLAVAVLTLPPLRERSGDVDLLLDNFLANMNKEHQPESEHKKLSPAAKKFMCSRIWPGNVRELGNALTRAYIWAAGETITEDEVRGAVFSTPQPGSKQILGRPFGNDFDLDGLLDQVAKNYIERALGETGNKKKKAAELLGFASHQRLDYWRRRLKIF
jgi:transcriptional regulator with PAS, ATPase and Fis domain